MRIARSAALQRQSRRLFEKFAQHVDVLRRHASLACAFKGFLAHQGKGVERILPSHQAHKPGVTHEGCAQCFRNRFVAAEVAAWDWVQWTDSGWAFSHDIETGARLQ